jgi:hypothetical protein
MPTTPRFHLRYLGVGDSARNLRADLQANAETTETALENVQALVAQLAVLLPTGGQTVIGLDIDGRPYYDPSGVVASPVLVGLDTDGRPYYLAPWS